MASDVKEPQTPSGDKYQRYNYVITEGGDIIVAVWKPKIGSSDLTPENSSTSE